jgi:hypothetical protein
VLATAVAGQMSAGPTPQDRKQLACLTMSLMIDIRDITADLRARLDLIQERRRAEDDRHSQAVEEINKEEMAVQAMLALEEKLLANGRAKALEAKPLRSGAATKFESEILEILSNADEWEHSDIKRELLARGVGDADDPNFGRGLQGVLLSMRGRELVELTGLRKWRITAKGLGRELPVRRRVIGAPSSAS